MKKTLLSIIAGLAVVNAASAVPSAADRRSLCEKYPDKYVWVEKTLACVPINPCESNDDTIRDAYCFNEIILPSDTEKRNMIIDMYLNKVRKTAISEVIEVSSNVVGIKTNDGGYIAFLQDSTDSQSDCLMNLRYSVTAYGYNPQDLQYHHGSRSASLLYVSVDDASFDEKMNDIADFASVLQGDFITYNKKDSLKTDDIPSAVFVCPYK